MEKIKKDIEMLKEIHQELEENYFDDEWDLCDFHKEELCRITGAEENDWDDHNLSYYIGAMERTLHLIQVYS